MPGDYAYFRKYFILNDDYTNISDIKPKGHGKVEVRGNKGIVRINLEDCEEEEEYRVYILKEKDGGIEDIELGRIITDERGRTRYDIRISLSELKSKGYSIEEGEAVVIKKGEHILLSGYIDKNSNILNKYVQDFKSEDFIEDQLDEKEYAIEESIESEIDQFEEPEIVEEPQELEEKSDMVKKEEFKEEVHDTEEAEEFEELYQEPEVIPQEEIQSVEPVDLPKDFQVERESYDQSYEQENQTYEYIEYNRRQSHKEQMTDYILSVLKYFPQVQPLKMYLHGYTWWKIDDNGRDSYSGFLPYYNYLLSADYKYPFMEGSTSCINQIRKYGHYLFGFYKEENEAKYYVYAVPGRFDTEEHPFKGITGFNTWYDSIDEIGYWILYIDPLTGKVIYPINPMIPTD